MAYYGGATLTKPKVTGTCQTFNSNQSSCFFW
jgi:hypothetical protein